MPFYVIKGHFKPQAGIPDGDSVRFLAQDLEIWSKLGGRKPVLGTGKETKDTVQLRFEGIDSIEKGAIKPLSIEARENMFKLIKYHEVRNPEPEGYVLARMTDDKSGRPIAFVFPGTTRWKDGAYVTLTAEKLRASVNYKQILAGYAYPLYYNTLFASLRNEFNRALKVAKKKKTGYWPVDKTTKGVIVKSKSDLAKIKPIWPKLWRRLEEYFRKNNSLDGFVEFLEKKNERLDILPIMEERGFQDLVVVKGDKVKMTEEPENIRVRGKAGLR